MATEISATPHQEMEKAYLEYRRACYNVLYKHALKRGFFDKLETPTPLEELMTMMDYLPERRESVSLFLKALSRFGALDAEADGNGARYSKNAVFEKNGVEFDIPSLTLAIGSDKVEDLIHSNSYKGIIDTFTQELNPVAVDFVSENIDLWDQFLNTPFYRYSRDRAIDAVAQPGGKVLDLGSGPGFGLLRHSRNVGPEGLVIGLERSRDFVVESVRRTADLSHVRTIPCDLDEGFSFLRDDFFDGAMNIGVFHFLKSRDLFFSELSRVLKPGGRLSVGYVYSENGSYDQELMDLRFYLREPPSVKSSRKEMTELAARSGFEGPIEAFNLGCFEWCLFAKKA